MNNRVLYWEIIDVCNLRCKYCFYETGLSMRKYKSLNKDLYKEYIANIGETFNSIVFTGGEALLHTNIFELIKETKKNNINLTLISDGLGLTEPVIEKLILLGLDSISVSLDSFNAQLNSEIRIPNKRNPIDISEKIIANVINLVEKYKEKIPITILQSVCSKNIDNIIEMSKFAKKNNIRHLVHPVGMPENLNYLDDINLTKLSEEKTELLYKNLYKWADSDKGLLEFVDITVPFVKKLKKPENLKCPMGLTNYFADIEGNLFPCFHRTDIKLGNIFKDDIKNMVSIKRHKTIENISCAELACTCILEKNSYEKTY